MDAERLERAARALADEASFTRAMIAEYMAQRVRDDDMERQMRRLGLATGNVRAALDAAPEPAPRCTRCGEPITPMQSQLPDEVGLPRHKNCPAPAQAWEAVAWGVRRVRTGIIVAAEITKDAAVERASDLTRTLQEEFSTDGHGIPLYAAPSRPGGAAPPAPEAAQLERVAREAAGRAWRLGYIRGASGARNWSDSDQADVVARAIAAAKGGAS